MLCIFQYNARVANVQIISSLIPGFHLCLRNNLPLMGHSWDSCILIADPALMMACKGRSYQDPSNFSDPDHLSQFYSLPDVGSDTLLTMVQWTLHRNFIFSFSALQEILKTQKQCKPSKNSLALLENKTKQQLLLLQEEHRLIRRWYSHTRKEKERKVFL